MLGCVNSLLSRCAYQPAVDDIVELGIAHDRKHVNTTAFPTTDCSKVTNAIFKFAVILLAASCLLGHSAIAQPRKTLVIEFDSDEGRMNTVCEVVREFNGGKDLLVMTPEGRLWPLEAESIVSRTEHELPMVPLTSEEVFEQLKSQLEDGFKLHKTKHYLMIHNTNPAYAKWVGELYENVYRSFYNYWKKRADLEEPRFPLVSVVFNSRNAYLRYGQRDVGDSVKAMIGYYNLNTNRMISYDMTGTDGVFPKGRRGNQIPTSRVIQQILTQPQAERTVATIVHEAVHQISYNSGLQVRLVDNPRWLSEGLAMFCESPDFKRANGWSLGNVNFHRLSGFRNYSRIRSADSLATLIGDDSRSLNGKTAQHAYDESWALTYFLIKTKNKEYAAYLKEIATLRPLDESTPRERIDMFKNYFGDLQTLDKKFMQYMRRF